MMINVTRSFMPPMEEYQKYLEQIWKSRYLTNEGPLLNDLVDGLKKYLKINNIELVTNGTIALQLTLRALDITEGEIITTPFSFVATTTSIIWERCKPVFVDIDEKTLCIDANKIENAITKNTKAIMAVHVFGYPCDVEKIQEIANKYNLKVIYDGAHAFGSKYRGKSLLSYGDVTTCSFHATKLFHTIEGGACVAREKSVSEKIKSIKNFGSVNGEYKYIGINAKMTEFNSAMGLANLNHIDEIIEERRKLSYLYDKNLKGIVSKIAKTKDLEYNYIYYPIILKSEEETLKIIKKLNENNINPRRYFYPALNRLEYIENKGKCPIAEDISRRILCLPLYNGLKENEVLKICEIIKKEIK